MLTENNITENMRAKLAVWDYPVSDKYFKIRNHTFNIMKRKREWREKQIEWCKKCPAGQEMCDGLNCTIAYLMENQAFWPGKQFMPWNMEEALVQIRATPERPSSDNQGFALVADATDAR